MFKVPSFLKPADSRDWRYRARPNDNVGSYILDRELDHRTRHSRSWNGAAFAATRLPTVFREREINMAGHDKIFAGAWLSPSQIIMGTKCNRLVVVNIDNNKCFEIPLLQVLQGPFQQSSTALSEEDDPFLNVSPHCTGIHSLAVNPSGTMLAVGAGQPMGVTIYRLPTLEPLAALTGHTDMVFAIAWMNDDILVSGSRDMSLQVWSASSSEVAQVSILDMILKVRGPMLALKEHKSKVRDLKYNRNTKQIMSLSTDGCVKFWDSTRFTPLGTVSLYHTNETVAIGMNEKQNLYSVGSLEHVSVVDPRVGTAVHDWPTVDESWGVRSLSFDEHVVTTGGGMGRISFYDLRSMKHVLLADGNPFFQTGPGWLDHDSTYTGMFQGVTIYNAVYTLLYDASGTKLFAAGGPLQLGLCGSYAAVFS